MADDIAPSLSAVSPYIRDSSLLASIKLPLPANALDERDDSVSDASGKRSGNDLSWGSSPFHGKSAAHDPKRYIILIVEDSAPNRKLLELSLKRLKYNVSAVNDGSEAVKTFRAIKEYAAAQQQLQVSAPLPTAATSNGASSNGVGSHDSAPSTTETSPVTESAQLKQRPNSASASDAYGGALYSDLIPPGATPRIPLQTPSNITHVPGTNYPTRIDLVLMDSNMPVMNGIEATKLIRSMGFTAVPILGVTGNALEEDVQEFLSAGANDLLTKPVHIPQLKTAITRYLRHQ